MSIIVEAVTSTLVEAVLKGLFKVFQITHSSKTWGEELKASISLLKPTVDKICTNFSDSDSETGKQFKHFQDVLQDGLNDAEIYERLWVIDFRRLVYEKKFQKFQKSVFNILDILGPPSLHLELHGLTAAATNLDQRVERIERLLEDAFPKTTNNQTANASIINNIDGVIDMPNEERHNSHHSIDCSYQAPVMPKCVGLDEPINVVRELLLRNDVNRVDVRGMGGIGKTTLASALCNDPQIQGFFENNIVFITVTESPNMMELLNIIWDKITKSTRPIFQSIEDARNQLQKFLSVNAPRPTLVVLNDVWSKLDLENLWFKAEGYKTMLTTRHKFGILPTDGICVYDMNKLSDTYALELFCFSAFGCHFIPPTQDEELVKQVAAECKGLPLALNIIGSCLCGASLPDWRSAKAKLSRAEHIDEFHRDGVLNCLKKSVDFLDDQLKECFLDLGAFPKGRKFSVDALLDIWVYVRRIDRDIAFGVLLELARRNLLILSRDPGNPAISYNCSPELSLSQHDVAQCVRSPAISNDCSSELFFFSA